MRIIVKGNALFKSGTMPHQRLQLHEYSCQIFTCARELKEGSASSTLCLRTLISLQCSFLYSMGHYQSVLTWTVNVSPCA